MSDDKSEDKLAWAVPVKPGRVAPPDPNDNPVADSTSVTEIPKERVGDFVSHADDALLSYSEAGELIGRSATTIKRWVADKLLTPTIDPSGRRRIRISQLKAFYSAMNDS